MVIAAALSGTSSFGQLGAVTISIDSEQATAATATLDAGTSETTMLLAEVYQRHDRWRVRAVGQGYDDGLAQLATKYGVTVDLLAPNAKIGRSAQRVSRPRREPSACQWARWWRAVIASG